MAPFLRLRQRLVPWLSFLSSPLPTLKVALGIWVAHLRSQGFGKPLIMSATAGRQAALPARGQSRRLKEVAEPAQRGVRGACSYAGAAESERHSEQKRWLQAARPPEIDRQGAVTSGSWLQGANQALALVARPATTPRSIYPPQVKSQRVKGRRRRQRPLPVQNLQEWDGERGKGERREDSEARQGG